MADAVASGSTVLVDFTADWCLTCKSLEAAVLDTRTIADAIKANGVIVMRADWTHCPPELTHMLDQLGSRQVPVIAIFSAASPNEPIVLRGGYTSSTLLKARKGRPVETILAFPVKCNRLLRASVSISGCSAGATPASRRC